MKIDYEELKTLLKERLDTATAVAKCRSEVIKERNFAKDDTISLSEEDFIEKALTFECSKYIDMLYGRY